MFQTRIYPLPGGGTRTIKVVYTSELASGKDNTAIYAHPISLERQIDFEARVEVVTDSKALPLFANEGFGPVEFQNVQGGYVCHISRHDWSIPNASIAVVLPSQSPTDVYVEKLDEQTYFAISDDLPECHDEAGKPPAKYLPRTKCIVSGKIPTNIAILWDNSGSRSAAVRSGTFNILKH